MTGNQNLILLFDVSMSTTGGINPSDDQKARETFNRPGHEDIETLIRKSRTMN